MILIRIIALAALLAVASCGFQPVYAPERSGAARGDIGSVIIRDIPERTGFFLKQSLERRFQGFDSALPSRILAMDVTRTFSNIALQADNIGVRTEMRVASVWTLKDGVDSQRDLSGTTEVMVAFDQLDQPYGDIAAQSDAEERAATLLAERIWTQVLFKSAQAARN